MEILILKGNAKVYIDFQIDKGRCRGCYKTIYWASTENGKKMPICQDKDGTWISHFVDCPKSHLYRKGKGFVSPEDLKYKPRTNGVDTLSRKPLTSI